jgi:hypothetical protein
MHQHIIDLSQIFFRAIHALLRNFYSLYTPMILLLSMCLNTQSFIKIRKALPSTYIII